MATAVYLWNRSPTTAVKGMAPCEALTVEKLKDKRQKFDSKARRCIFLGYGMVTTGYRLYDVNCSKVLYSRDVVFDESKPGVEKEPKDDEPREPAEQDMYLDSGSDAESVVGQGEPMDGQAEEMVDQGGPVSG